jgi:hypothetical protein
MTNDNTAFLCIAFYITKRQKESKKVDIKIYYYPTFIRPINFKIRRKKKTFFDWMMSNSDVYF